MPSLTVFRQFDLSGAVQTATSRLLRKRNEVAGSKNAEFNRKIGSAARRYGYEQVGRTLQHGKDGLGLHVYKYAGNNKLLAGINNSGDTNATLQYLGSSDYWYPLITDAAPNTRFQMINYLDEVYVAGFAESTNSYLTLQNIDSTLVSSATRNVFKAPKSRLITEYAGSLYAIDCEVNGVKYPNRAYKSSAPLGAITFVQEDQSGLLQQLRVDSVKYLKPGMAVDIYKGGTEAKLVDSLTIVSVDKVNNAITFNATSINVKDNDEIWLEDRKGKLSILWNTDHPTPEDSDYLQIPSGLDQDARYTGWGQNNNRLLLFTKNSMMKWDGANLITVSSTTGCVSHETIKNIGSWTIWLHTTGIWGYNDSTGQLKLLSRPVENYIKAINQNRLATASANVFGRVYKVAVGEIADLDSITTSTSTSSTSTSTTSISTSSTSTSSTSTSSTSSSTSQSSTSTSSTSISTSSTSTSSTSTSVSTSSTSTSLSTSSTTTTTVASTREVVRLVYDFDMNAWWPEYHKREFKFHVNHTMHGYTKPYFIDETGRVFRDETGNLDHFDTIPFEVEIGRSNFGVEQLKNYLGCYVESESARTALLMASVDNGQFKDVGQIIKDVEKIDFANLKGRDINYKISHNDGGEPPVIDGIASYWSHLETGYGQGE